MSLVDKIPPLISALAFGYGVGMAAPDSALETMNGPQQGAAQTSVKGQRVAQPVAEPLPVTLEQRMAGGESSHLAKLRASRAPSRLDDADASREGWGGYSRGPREVSSFYDEDLAAEMDDLEATETAAISRLQLPELGLGVSRQTLKYVRFFTKTDKGRGMFTTWLKRSGRYQEMIQTELRERRLPEDLIWVAMIESGFDATAKSPMGAMGLWQFMPATGAVYGLRQNKFVDQRRNPKLATEAAAHHLRDLYMRFGQWDLALAAYNMGYEQLLDRIDRVGTTDFNELVRAGVMPSETSKYVPKIVAAAIVANNLERFGFDDVRIGNPVDGAEIAVPPRTPLETIAKAAGVSTSEIRKLNPDIMGKHLPPGKGDFLISVPSESVSRTTAALPAMLDLHRNQIDDVEDPLDMLSPDGYRRRPSTDDGSLLALLPKPKKRRSMRAPLEEFAEEIGVAEVAEVDRRDRAVDRDVEPSSKPRSGRETVIYRVGAGDTLIGVARQFAMDVDDVAQQNGLKTNEKLREGALLKLKVRREIVEDVDSAERTERKTAKKPTG
jgi:membrane-bound lytic murein transglycosylase D